MTSGPSRFFHRTGERTKSFVGDPSTESGPECALLAERILPQSDTTPTKFQLLYSNRGSSLQTSAGCRSRTGPPWLVGHRHFGADLLKPAVRFLLRHILFQYSYRVLPYGLPRVCMQLRSKILHFMGSNEYLGKTRTASPRSTQIWHSDIVYLTVNIVPDHCLHLPPIGSRLSSTSLAVPSIIVHDHQER